MRQSKKKGQEVLKRKKKRADANTRTNEHYLLKNIQKDRPMEIGLGRKEKREKRKEKGKIANPEGKLKDGRGTKQLFRGSGREGSGREGGGAGFHLEERKGVTAEYGEKTRIGQNNGTINVKEGK